MDHARALGRLGAGAERPRPALLVAGGEERAPARAAGTRARARRGHDALADAEVLEHLGALRAGPRRRRARPRARGTPPARRRRAAAAIASASSSWSSPMLTTDEHRLVREQEDGREQRALVGGEVRAVDRRAVAEHRDRRARARRSPAAATCRPSRRRCFGRAAARPTRGRRSPARARGSRGRTRGRCRPSARSTKRIASQSRSEPSSRLPRPSPGSVGQARDVHDLEVAGTTFFECRHRGEAVEPVVRELDHAEHAVRRRGRVRPVRPRRAGRGPNRRGRRARGAPWGGL